MGTSGHPAGSSGAGGRGEFSSTPSHLQSGSGSSSLSLPQRVEKSFAGAKEILDDYALMAMDVLRKLVIRARVLRDDPEAFARDYALPAGAVNFVAGLVNAVSAPMVQQPPVTELQQNALRAFQSSLLRLVAPQIKDRSAQNLADVVERLAKVEPIDVMKAYLSNYLFRVIQYAQNRNDLPFVGAGLLPGVGKLLESEEEMRNYAEQRANAVIRILDDYARSHGKTFSDALTDLNQDDLRTIRQEAETDIRAQMSVSPNQSAPEVNTSLSLETDSSVAASDGRNLGTGTDSTV